MPLGISVMAVTTVLPLLKSCGQAKVAPSGAGFAANFNDFACSFGTSTLSIIGMPPGISVKVTLSVVSASWVTANIGIHWIGQLQTNTSLACTRVPAGKVFLAITTL